MKKRALLGIGIFLLLTVVVLFTIFKSRPAHIYIKGLGNNRFQLIVNNRPYIIKGVVYNPVPIGENHTYDFWSDPHRPYISDGVLMKKIGVNTIRVYKHGNDIAKTKYVINEFYRRFGIRTAMGHWLGFWENPNYGEKYFRERVKKDVLNMVETFKNEKGLLLWILGNENNVSFSFSPQTENLWTTDEIEALGDPYLKRIARARIYYSFVNELAQEIHKIDPHHPVVLANAELTDIEIADEVGPDIDILGCSIYRGKSFGSFFRQVAMKFKRPVIVTEFGCDAFDAYMMKENEEVQAEFISAQWKEIEKNVWDSGGVGNSLGGFIFEWTDEWWKYNEENSSEWHMHNTQPSWSNGAYYYDIKAPDNMNINEEWWGICKVKKTGSGLDERIPRKAYFVLKNLWK